MRILILTGSAHLHGTTALLADEFCIGAKEAGHQVVRFDTAKLNIHPCIGCRHCRRNDGKCVYDDDMSQIYPHLMTADTIVLVTPLYYYGITAQLKSAVDRFFSLDPLLRGTPKKLLLICAGSDTDDWAMDALKVQFYALCRYHQWQAGGTVLALGLSTKQDAENSAYKAAARDLGATL